MDINNFTEKSFKEFLFDNIPITREMGTEIITYKDDLVEIKGSLEKNINHKKTAFGGSINTFLTLSCWAMAFKLIKPMDEKAHIVIQESCVSYLKPISTDFVSTCSYTDTKGAAKYINMYKKYGRSRIELTSQIIIDNEVYASFKGKFVAFK